MECQDFIGDEGAASISTLASSITDILSTNVAMFPVLIYVLASAGVNADTAVGSMTKILKASTLLFISSPISGGLCSELGGYVAARIAKHDELLNGGLSSILCVASGLSP